MQWSRAAIVAATIMLGCSGDEGGATPQDGGGSDMSSESSADDVAFERGPMGDVSSDAAPADRFIDLFDVFPLPDGPVGVCVTCIRDRCGAEVNECANSDACRAGLLCTLTTCVATGGGGAPDLACVTGCFMGDFRAALVATGSFSCINTNCSTTCLPPASSEGGTPGDGGTEAGDSSDAGPPGDDAAKSPTGDAGPSIDTGVADADPGD